MRNICAALMFGAILLVCQAAGAGGISGPGGMSDAFLCYRAALAKGQPAFPKGLTKSLEDRFGGPQTFGMTRVVAFCAPASRDGSVVAHPLVHLKGFAIKAQKGAPKFTRFDRLRIDAFGERRLSITAPATLLDVTPAALGTTLPPAFGADPTAETDVNRFKCYKAKLAKGAPKLVAPSPPTLRDTIFVGGQNFAVQRVARVCEPVDEGGKTPGAETRPSGLVCYAVKPVKGSPRFVKTSVATNDGSGTPHLLVATAPAELCLPAIEPVATPTPMATPTVTSSGGSDPTPSATASPAPAKRVFVTSTTTKGGFGGVAGADAICMGRAGAAGLVGTFKAWVSVTGNGPATRFAPSTSAYVLIGGTTIASNWGDLVDGSLAHAINVDENGLPVAPSDVWTATTTAGSPTALNCNGFANETGTVFGVCGSTTTLASGWTNASTPSCNTPLRLYCFEQ